MKFYLQLQLKISKEENKISDKLEIHTYELLMMVAGKKLPNMNWMKTFQQKLELNLEDYIDEMDNGNLKLPALATERIQVSFQKNITQEKL